MINAVGAIRLLSASGSALFTHAALHGQLARMEWAEEKVRLYKMFALSLLGISCILCFILFGGILLLLFNWESTHRLLIAMLVLAFYGLGAGIAWWSFQVLSARSDQAFAATREELAADIALLKSIL